MSTEYAVALEGNPIALDDLREIFRIGPIQVQEIEVAPDLRITALITEEFNSLPSDTLISEVTRRLLSLINGALFASDPDRSLVRSGASYMREGEGRRRATYTPSS